MIKRALFTVLFLMIFCVPVFAQNTQIIFSGANDTAFSTTTNQYAPMHGLNDGVLVTSTTLDAVRTPMPTSGTIQELKINLGTAPGGSGERVFTIYKNDVATTVTCTVSSATTTCATTNESFTVARGDWLYLESDPNNSPAATTVQWSWKFVSDNEGEFLVMGGSGNTALSGTTDYINPNAFHQDTVENDVKALWPVACTFGNMIGLTATAPGSGKTITVTLRTGTGVGAMSSSANQVCVFSDAGTTCSDTSGTETLAAGDVISYEVTYSGTPSLDQTQVSATCTATTPGEYAITATMDDLASNAATEYTCIDCGDNTWSTTRTNSLSLGQDVATIEAFYVALWDGAPGTAASGKGSTYTLYQGASGSELSCSVTDTAQTCNDTGTVVVSDGDLFSVEAVPANTPTARRTGFAIRVQATDSAPPEAPFVGLVLSGASLSGFHYDALQSKIYPAGDSTTYGASSTDGMGWRKYVQDGLGTTAYNWVGRFHNPNPTYNGYDTAHAGSSGQPTSTIESRLIIDLPIEMSPVPVGSVVIIMAGTNDIALCGGSMATCIDDAVANIEDMIDAVAAHDPTIDVYVLTVTPRDDAHEPTDVDAFNADLDVMMAAYQATKSNLYYVDTVTPFRDTGNCNPDPGACLADSVHPNDAGYALIGTAILGAWQS